jgi:hypothetical protein
VHTWRSLALYFESSLIIIVLACFIGSILMLRQSRGVGGSFAGMTTSSASAAVCFWYSVTMVASIAGLYSAHGHVRQPVLDLEQELTHLHRIGATSV